ncbi:MAG: hypothetical protein M9947_01710 [Thermomicrobiales bacterium]|nr:hypothetical protein [Thermomicrobiales bacterium]
MSSQRCYGARFFLRLLIVLLPVIGSFLPIDLVAQEPVSYAGIVIRPGDGTITYVYVPLDEPVSGIELLRRSGVSLVTIGFGAFGEGVCQIQETGCDVGTCRKNVCQTGGRESPYWRYFQVNETGAWAASPLGASGSRVEPGDIDGWSWSPDEPLLPEIEISEIPMLARAGDELDTAHVARYDANGSLIGGAPSEGVELTSYLAVTVVLSGVAVLALVLRFRRQASI